MEYFKYLTLVKHLKEFAKNNKHSKIVSISITEEDNQVVYHVVMSDAFGIGQTLHIKES